MKAKIWNYDGGTYDSLQIKCPACKTSHYMRLRQFTNDERPSWVFNGDLDKPSLSPSVNNKTFGCHFFIKDGFIEYCGDCKHELKGKKIELPDITEDD